MILYESPHEKSKDEHIIELLFDHGIKHNPNPCPKCGWLLSEREGKKYCRNDECIAYWKLF